MAMPIVRANSDWHDELGETHKEIRDNNQKMKTKPQQTHNANTNVASHNFYADDYVMMHLAKARHESWKQDGLGHVA